MKINSIVITLFLLASALHAVDVGEMLPDVVLDGKHGGTSDKKAWSSKSLKGKTHVIIYMDPDKRKEGMPFLDKLNDKNFDKDSYSTIAIVNLAATWMPDAILEKMLSKKEKDLKNTTFIFDKDKYLVKKWHLKDDASNILVCDKEGKVLFQKSGKLSSSETDDIMKIISKNIN